jgi:chorismate mutase
MKIDTNLSVLRQKIDAIDEQIIKNIAQRFAIVQQVKQYKKTNNIAVQDANREAKLLLRVSRLAKKNNLSVEFVAHLFDIIMHEARQQQKT